MFRSKLVLCVCILLALLAGISSSYATQQIPEQLRIGADVYDLEEEPLNSLFPPEELIERIQPGPRCSASWRGYKATWGLNENVLYLLDVQKNPCGNNGVAVPAEHLLEGASYPIEVTWFSGRLTARTGRFWPEWTETDANGRTIEHAYSYEIEVFLIANGILVNRGVEVVELSRN